MFRGGHDVRFVDAGAVALKAFDCRDAEARHEVGIFAVGFFRAAPARIASEIENGREAFCTPRARASAASAVKTSWSNSGSQVDASADRRGIRRALVGDVAVQAFVVKHHGNAEARVLLHPLLQRVGELRFFARAVGDFAGTRHLADAVLQQDGGVVGEERAFVIDEARLGSPHEDGVLPDAFDLRDFFFERHAREEIGEALFDGEFGVAVGAFVGGCCCCGGLCAFAWRVESAGISAISETTNKTAENLRTFRKTPSMNYFYACN